MIFKFVEFDINWVKEFFYTDLSYKNIYIAKSLYELLSFSADFVRILSHELI